MLYVLVSSLSLDPDIATNSTILTYLGNFVHFRLKSWVVNIPITIKALPLFVRLIMVRAGPPTAYMFELIAKCIDPTQVCGAGVGNSAVRTGWTRAGHDLPNICLPCQLWSLNSFLYRRWSHSSTNLDIFKMEKLSKSLPRFLHIKECPPYVWEIIKTPPVSSQITPL